MADNNNGFLKTRSSSGWETERGNVVNGSLKIGDAEGYARVQGGGGISADASGVLEMIDTFDRPGGASAERVYAGTGKYAEGGKNEPGKRLPKAGVYAEAGVGRAGAQWSVFDAEAKGPNACAKAEASVGSLGASAFAKAEVASASASAGPVKATVGLSADTGVGISAAGAEVKVLGTGFSFGRTMGISLFGTGFEFKLW